VSLCADCHTQASQAYHRIGKRAFERLHRIRFTAIGGESWRDWKEQRAA
jgi:hypothetical protein